MTKAADYDRLVSVHNNERMNIVPRCVPYTMISIATIVAISALGLSDLLIASVVLVHGAVLLLDPGSVDFRFGERKTKKGVR